MAQFSTVTRTGSSAVDALSTKGLPHCQPNITLGNTGNGLYCTGDELRKFLMKSASQATVSKGSLVAISVLTGTFAGRVLAKSLHKDGEITCYTYRKIKDLVTHQPWFCIPLITVPLVNYNSTIFWRPPIFSYVMLVGGWVLNMSSHILTIATKDERWKTYPIPISFISLGVAGAAAFLGFLFSSTESTC
ncbi:uncharacterized protein [Watersipora subatra]|uniref:uncharacterized protein n=1 Tax=Watersipora subatra TaxID=2589382 RepID=UPI00355C180D